MDTVTATTNILLHSLADTQRFAAQIANVLDGADVVYLQGNLGAGKTTLTQYILRELGVTDTITSPTYALIESYESQNKENFLLYHLDLYRLSDPEELEYVGIRELFTPTTITLIEWPDKGLGVIPDPTITITIKNDLSGPNNTRRVTITASADKLTTLNCSPKQQ